MVGDTIPQDNEVKPLLNTINRFESLSITDLRNIVNLKYASDAQFARDMGWSNPTACRLLSGDWIPQQPKVIHKLAQVLYLDVIKLTRLFDGYANPKIVTADKLKQDDVSTHTGFNSQ